MSLALVKDSKALRGKKIRDICFAGDTFAIVTDTDEVYACTFHSTCVECGKPARNYMGVVQFMPDIAMYDLEQAVNKRVPKLTIDIEKAGNK